ncbi:MAG: hypothetical protein H6773_04230 [Pseudomonadales bacterium]|nr:hypothetical protein [Pseudomonadales bacterium]
MTETRYSADDLTLDGRYDLHSEQWEQSLEIVNKLSELSRSLQASQSSEKVLPGLSRYLEKNQDKIKFAFAHTELLTELVPSLAILTAHLQTSNISFEIIQRVESILSSNVNYLVLFDPVKYTELIPSYLAILDYLYGYLDSDVSSAVAQKLNP